jgi:hypothetical protein
MNEITILYDHECPEMSIYDRKWISKLAFLHAIGYYDCKYHVLIIC